MTAALGTKVAAAAPVIPNFGGGGTCVRQNKLFCWDWFSAHWGDTFQPALLDHIKLTLIAVGIGFAISFVAALVLSLVSTAVAGAPTDTLKQTVDQVVKLLSDPALADCHYNLGLLYEKLGKPKEAIRHMARYRALIGGGSN